MGSDSLASGIWGYRHRRDTPVSGRKNGEKWPGFPLPHVLVVSLSYWLRLALRQLMGEPGQCSLQGPASGCTSGKGRVRALSVGKQAQGSTPPLPPFILCLFIALKSALNKTEVTQW